MKFVLDEINMQAGRKVQRNRTRSTRLMQKLTTKTQLIEFLIKVSDHHELPDEFTESIERFDVPADHSGTVPHVVKNSFACSAT